VGEVETGDVHPGAEHLAQDGDVAGRRSERADHLEEEKVKENGTES